MAKMTKLQIRIFQFVDRAETAGVTKSDLFRRFSGTRKQELDAALLGLLENFELYEVLDEESNQGRKPLRYYTKTHRPDAEMEEVEVLPLILASQRTQPGKVCRQCGQATPTSGQGRPAEFCSLECRKSYREGGITLCKFLERAQDPRVFAQAAFMLAALDAYLHGYNIAFELFGLTSFFATDDTGHATRVEVYPIRSDGHFIESVADCDCAALVYRNGKIVYTGKFPLVTKTEDESEKK